MKKFTWTNFDEEFISSIIYSSQTGEDKKPARVIDDKDMLIPYIEGIALIPTKEFVVNYRREVEQHFLGKQQELVEKIYYTIKKNKLQNYKTMLNELSKMTLSASLIDSYITALKEIGSIITNLKKDQDLLCLYQLI